jgi:RNA polymerase sigma-70 factor (ECF subfamily)
MRTLWKDRKKAGEDKDRDFEELALTHINSLYNLALRLSKNVEEAEDLVQDTYLQAYRSFHQFKKGTNCRAWLSKILYNSYINIYRKKRRSPQRESFEEVGSQFQRSFAHAEHSVVAGPEEELLRKSTTEEVRIALDEMLEEYRVVVIFSDIEGLSYKEIAEITASPLGTVMSRLHRGRKQLREILLKHVENRE